MKTDLHWLSLKPPARAPAAKEAVRYVCGSRTHFLLPWTYSLTLTAAPGETRGPASASLAGAGSRHVTQARRALTVQMPRHSPP